MGQIVITKEILDRLHNMHVLLKYNSAAPADGKYGWLTEGQLVSLSGTISIEQNSGLFGGPYKPMIGGRKSSGLATIGAFSYSYSPLPERVTVGRYCSISSGLKFIDSSHPLETVTTSAFMFRPKNLLFSNYQSNDVLEYAKKYVAHSNSYPKIGHDVWIGSNVTLSSRVSIGNGAVIAANSTVTKDVPPYAIVGGNPAKIIKYRFNDDLIQNLLTSEWWEYDPREMFSRDPSDLNSIIETIDSGTIEKLEFDTISL